jgi:O-Antigen ligase
VVVPAVAITAIGIENAGYFPTTWGWVTISFAALAVVGLTRTEAIAYQGLLLLCALVAVVGWTALSLTWTISRQRTLDEVERSALILVATAALLVVARTARSLVAGTIAGTATLGLVALVLYARAQDVSRFEGTLLFRPVGYANGLGAIVAIGLALTVVAAGEELPVAARAGATAAAALLAGALVLTESRGAILALAVGIVAAVALVPDRRSLVERAAPAGAIAASGGGVAAGGGPHELWLLPTLLSVAVAGGLASVFVRRIHWRLVVAASALALVVGVVLAVHRGVGMGDRPAYWRAAFATAGERPAAGTGAGTFELDWLVHRHRVVATRDAHSLELETLAELGPVGVLGVLVMLAIPLRAGVRARRSSCVAAAAAGYVVLVVHSAVDWDWEQPAVWLTGLAPGVALTLGGSVGVGRRTGVAAAGALAALAGAAMLALHGHRLLHHARSELARGTPSAAVAAAAAARRWQPWSSEAALVEARGELLLAQADAARVAVLAAVRRDPNDPGTWEALAALSSGPDADAAQVVAHRLDPLGRP